MFNHRFEQDAEHKVVLHWFLLSLNGGFINAGGFLATGRFVSHVTGFATLFGVDVSNSKFTSGLGILSVPFYFLLGAFLAGLLIDRPIHQGKKPHFDWVMGLSGLCLFLAASGHYLGSSTFGASVQLKESYTLLALLCMACGLQNAAITSSSGRSIRTTHLTGLTTDLGLGLSRMITMDLATTRMKKELRANYLRAGSIFSFVMGSAMGAFVFHRMGYLGFFFPSLVTFYAAWHGKKAKVSPHVVEYEKSSPSQ